MCRTASDLCDALKKDPSANPDDCLASEDLMDALCTTFRMEHEALTQRREKALLELIRQTCPDNESAKLILSGGGSMCPVWNKSVGKILQDHPHIVAAADAEDNEVFVHILHGAAVHC